MNEQEFENAQESKRAASKDIIIRKNSSKKIMRPTS